MEEDNGEIVMSPKERIQFVLEALRAGEVAFKEFTGKAVDLRRTDQRILYLKIVELLAK